VKILIHTCCAPCLIHPYDLFTGRGYEVVPYFYNPNIHPFREYRERYFAALDYASEKNMELRAGPYEMERFIAETSPCAGDRCECCYRMRLERSAAEARALGIEEYSTTLLVSPYQDQGQIEGAGQAAAKRHGVMFAFEDMSPGYRESVRISREAGMYRQKYCGCIYSEKERYQKSDPPRR